MANVTDFSPLPLIFAAATNQTHNPDYVFKCPIDGKPDLYGLGIRVGIYIQMLTVQLSAMTATLLDTDDVLGQAVVIFILSVGTVLWQLIKDGTIEAIEVAPIITLLMSQLASCRVPWWRSQLTLVIFVGELVALTTLNLWFWYKGMNYMPRSCPDDYAWFFAKVSIWHWFRTFNKVTSVLAGISAYGGALAYTAVIGTFAIRDPVKFFRGQLIDEEDRRSSLTASLSIFVTIGMIVYVEMAIKWNHIQGVMSIHETGQFMPLFIALAQLIATVYQLARTGAQMAVDEEAFAGAHDDSDDDLECEHFRDHKSGAYTSVVPLNHVQQQGGVVTDSDSGLIH